MKESAEKTRLRAARGRVADVHEQMWAERTAHLTARGLDLLAPAPGAQGLDIACGPGATTVALAERLGGGTTLGIDFAPEMVARAGERFGERTDVRWSA